MSDFFERIFLLKQTPMFSEVNTDDLRWVANELQEQLCFAGERVFHMHDPSDRAYIIERGLVGISLSPDPAEKAFIARLGPRECFGEMGIFDDQPRSATAHVIEDATLLSLEKAKFRALVTRYPELGLGVLRGLSLRLREANLRRR